MKDNEKNIVIEDAEVEEPKNEGKLKKFWNKAKKPVIIAGKVVGGIAVTALAFIVTMAIAENVKKPDIEDDNETIDDGPFAETDNVPNTDQE